MKKTLLIPLILLMIAVAVTCVPASDSTVNKSLLYDDIKITLDSREIRPADVNGNYIEPFIIEGTTYLPVRGIASSLGLSVGWDGETNTVSLTEPKNDEKSILFNDDGIKAVYNGFEVTESGVAMSFSVNNSGKKDIYFDVTVSLADGKSIEKHKEYMIISGRNVNIRHLVPGIERADKIKFIFSLKDAETQFDICSVKEFTATPDGAEPSDKKPKVSYSDPEGDITHESFEQFFKAYGEFKKGRYSKEYNFSDRHDCHTGTVSAGYSIPNKDLHFDAAVITEVYDPVQKTTAPAPVIMEINHVQGEELYKFKISSVLNGISWSADGEIKFSDMSVTSKGVKLNEEFDDIDQKYTRLESLKALDEMAEKLAKQVLDVVVKEVNNFFAEKDSRLNLEFFGLK
ncbi:MAG: copper amine oxidase N-terminal domain-containing protein [Ruminococcaceae bacterium]|nr:copper amine oxidase N-terminal domain-containing protein [Oscillospiraceae bacterium]